MKAIRICLFILVLPIGLLVGAEPAFEIREGDRVLLIGDTLIEREGGHLELRMHEQFPDRKFIVRNLGFAGDTPLGWSRAEFDPPAKGWERLKEQLALVRPTVAVIGYGMAASLQELTDRSGDHSLNPDPVRYGAEPMSAARFKKELAQLMDAIAASPESKVESPGSKAATAVRFILLSPIRHEDLRAEKPGLPDPAAHNQLLDQYSKAIEELARERGARFVSLAAPQSNYAKFMLGNEQARPLTDNGIHLRPSGYQRIAGHIAEKLGWDFTPKPVADYPEDQFQALVARKHQREEALLPVVARKNELFFHRWRPANSTYLFGFRKHEQGQNAAEIPKFDPLIERAEAEIDLVKRSFAAADKGTPSRTPATAAVPDKAVKTAAPGAAKEPIALPQFAVQDGYQIELWAENPLLEKPTQINWDALGRLWVCSSSLYPQIAPGEPAHDKILILEDTDRDGKADKSTVFADGLLIPTGVEPDLVERSKVEGPGTKARAPSTLDSGPSTSAAACYVGQSTELLHLRDTDGDGKADAKRVVLSGFGTEDTHHIIHTLHWGHDGRLYFNQSVYIHSHVETPHGMVRLNSGGILAYDPRAERLEVFARGWWNSWGHQMDKWGQSFATDGAGSTGISWVIPGAVYPAYEGSRRIAPGISPGSYPKFCGLEILYSPHFPSDWQGNAITCDFRAHRIVRFALEDLSLSGAQPVTDDAKSAEGRRERENTGRVPNRPPQGGSAGYTAKEMPDFIRTSDIAFRPIDIKLGPDGALYIADWSNPVINHGEVDFRDPRRDKERGRLWRVSKKDAAPIKWEPLVAKKNEELLPKSVSENLWEKEHAHRILSAVTKGDLAADRNAHGELANEAPQLRAAAARTFVAPGARTLQAAGPIPPQLAALAADPNARVRLEALRTLATIGTAAAAEKVLESAPSGERGAIDPFQEYAAWLSINELAKPWTEAIANGTWKTEGRDAQLAWGLSAIEPTLASATIAKLSNENKIPLDGSGPWIELLGKAGGQKDLRKLFAAAETNNFSIENKTRVLNALIEAARLRNARPVPIKLDERPAAKAIRNAIAGGQKEPSSEDLDLGQLLDWHSRDGGGGPTDNAPRNIQLRLAITRLMGYWPPGEDGYLLYRAVEDEAPGISAAACESLARLGYKQLLAEIAERGTMEGRQHALARLAALDPAFALTRLKELLPRDTRWSDEKEALPLWRNLLATKDFPDKLAAALPKEMPKAAAVIALRAAREQGRKGEKLAAALASITGTSAPVTGVANDFKWMVDATKKDGDPARGELVYRRANLACVTCHAIGGAGGKVGPEMTSLGASAPLDYIIESTLNPAAKVKEGFNAVTYTLKDGALVSGVQARETAQEIFVRDVAGNEQAIVKANIASKQNIGSIMPAGLVQQLPQREQLDLFAFLGELGKPGPYDASKGQTARVWTLFRGTDGQRVLRGDLKNENSANAFTLVDGRLLKEQLAEALQLLPDHGETIYAVAQFQTATAGKTRLNLSGASKVWLDGKPLVIEPNLAPELPPGPHHLAVRLDVKQLPEALRVETVDGRFLGN